MALRPVNPGLIGTQSNSDATARLSPDVAAVALLAHVPYRVIGRSSVPGRPGAPRPNPIGGSTGYPVCKDFPPSVGLGAVRPAAPATGRLGVTDASDHA